jgi:RNA polymerase sigma-70 factor, ECF subfamily
VNTDRAQDLSLMTLVAAADPSAERTLDGRLRARSLRIARSLLRNEADANDAAQVSMLAIFKSAQSYRGESSLEHWADRIVVRTSVRVLAQRRSRSSVIDGNVAAEDLPVAASDTSLVAMQYLEHLSPPLRTVLVLKYGLEFSIEEIALVTEVSVNTVKDRLLRAKEAMRRVVRRDDVPFASAVGRKP